MKTGVPTNNQIYDLILQRARKVERRQKETHELLLSLADIVISIYEKIQDNEPQ